MNNPLRSIRGSVVLVTGAASGMGRATARRTSGVCPGEQRHECESAPLSPCTQDRADKSPRAAC